MAAKSNNSGYGNIAITIHWLSAFFIVVLLGSGFRASGTQAAAAKAAILQIHVPVGITVLILTLGRIAWWYFADTKPQSVPMPAWQDRSARAVHLLFYVVILGMTASGIGMMVLSGAGPVIFGASLEALPDFNEFAPRIPHGYGARLMVALIVLHAGAALYHYFILRDGLLRRMWFGARTK